MGQAGARVLRGAQTSAWAGQVRLCGRFLAVAQGRHANPCLVKARETVPFLFPFFRVFGVWRRHLCV